MAIMSALDVIIKSHKQDNKCPQVKLSQISQRCGLGYYSYEDASRQYVTEETMKALVSIGRAWSAIFPEIEIGIGDLSASFAGVPLLNAQGHRSHKTHTDGRCIDVRPIRKDRKHRPVSCTDTAHYDGATTAILIRYFFDNQNIKTILFNDQSIKGVKSCAGHNNHFHVKMKK